MNGVIENLPTASVASKTILCEKATRFLGFLFEKNTSFVYILLYKIKRHLIPVWGLRLFSIFFTLVAHERVRTHYTPNK